MWPNQLGGAGWCVGAACGQWGAVNLGYGLYSGTFFGSGGCYISFFMTLGLTDAWYLALGGRKDLTWTVSQSNGCGLVGGGTASAKKQYR